MKIALINNLYQPYQKGGTEKFCRGIIEQAAADGHDCFLISTKPGSNPQSNAQPRTYYLNSNYYHLDKKSKAYRYLWQIANLFNFGRGQKLKKILNAEKPDLLISNNLMGIGLKTFSIVRQLGLKQVHILHDVQLFFPSGLMLWGREKEADSLPARIYQSISRRLATGPEVVVSPSRWLLAEHEKRKFFPNSQKIVRENPATFSKVAIKREKKQGPTTFLFVGQIEKHKGVMFLIETFKKIPNNELRLNIIGSGSCFQEAIDRSCLDQRITLLGLKNKEELAQYLSAGDCLIVPSLCYENSPTVIREALSFNLPLIAANLGGIPEMISSKQGLLFEPNSEKDLIDKINYFLDHQEDFIYDYRPLASGRYLVEILNILGL